MKKKTGEKWKLEREKRVQNDKTFNFFGEFYFTHPERMHRQREKKCFEGRVLSLINELQSGGYTRLHIALRKQMTLFRGDKNY